MSNDNPAGNLDALKAEHRELDEHIRLLFIGADGRPARDRSNEAQEADAEGRIGRIVGFEYARHYRLNGSVPDGDIACLFTPKRRGRAFSPASKHGSLASMEKSDHPGPQARITSRLMNSLYTEAMLLADEARSYFNDAGRGDRATLEPFARVGFPCKSLKVTTRIMHIVAWLLTQRAIESGGSRTARGGGRSGGWVTRRTATRRWSHSCQNPRRN